MTLSILHKTFFLKQTSGMFCNVQENHWNPKELQNIHNKQEVYTVVVKTTQSITREETQHLVMSMCSRLQATDLHPSINDNITYDCSVSPVTFDLLKSWTTNKNWFDAYTIHQIWMKLPSNEAESLQLHSLFNLICTVVDIWNNNKFYKLTITLSISKYVHLV